MGKKNYAWACALICESASSKPIGVSDEPATTVVVAVEGFCVATSVPSAGAVSAGAAGAGAAAAVAEDAAVATGPVALA